MVTNTLMGIKRLMRDHAAYGLRVGAFGAGDSPMAGLCNRRFLGKVSLCDLNLFFGRDWHHDIVRIPVHRRVDFFDVVPGGCCSWRWKTF